MIQTIAVVFLCQTIDLGGLRVSQQPADPFHATLEAAGRSAVVQIEPPAGDVVAHWREGDVDCRRIILRHPNAVVSRLCAMGALAFADGSPAWLAGPILLSEPHRAGVIHAEAEGLSLSVDTSGPDAVTFAGRHAGLDIAGSARVVGADVVATWSDGRTAWRLAFGPDLRPRLSYCACRDPAGGCTQEACDRGESCQTATTSVCEWMASAPPTGGGMCGIGVAGGIGLLALWLAGLALVTYRCR